VEGKVVMLTINTYRGNQLRSINLYDLPIAGTWAHKLPGPDLYRELKKMGLAVDPSMGWMQLATVLGNHLADLKDATK
jgi:hypothetical protein